MTHYGRTAGVYPTPRPLPQPEPWTYEIQGGVRKRDAGCWLLGQRCGEPWGSNPESVGHYGPVGCQHGCPADVCQQQKRMQADELLDEEKSVEGGGGGGGSKDPDDDDLGDFIDLVARANNVAADEGTLLPQLKSSPCAMHHRHMPVDRTRDLDLLYATNSHGGKVTTLGKVRLTGESLTQPPSEADLLSPRVMRCSRSEHTPRGHTPRGVKDKGGGGEKGWKEGRGRKGDGRGKDRVISPPRGGRHQQYATQPRMMAMPAKLPAELPPSDVVMTWLKHGSAPAGESHFPDITHPANRIAARRRHNQSEVSE
ncbi:hypothetical protein ACOMHN_037487 [Nucella lapillus]